jgi:hypothetical protein
VQRRGGDHGIVDRRSVALCKREPRFVNIEGERLTAPATGRVS